MTNLATSQNPIINKIDATRTASSMVREIRLDKNSMLVSILIDGQPEKFLRAEATRDLPLTCMCNEVATYLEAKNHRRRGTH